DYWESGMDIRRTTNMYGNFIDYQRSIQNEFRAMQKLYGFDDVDGNRSPRSIQSELRGKIELILNGKSDHFEEESDEPDAKKGIARPTTAPAHGNEGDQPSLRRQSAARHRATHRVFE